MIRHDATMELKFHNQHQNDLEYECNKLRFQLVQMSAFHLIGILKEKAKQQADKEFDYVVLHQMGEALRYHVVVQGPNLGIPANLHKEDQDILVHIGRIHQLALYHITPSGRTIPFFIIPVTPSKSGELFSCFNVLKR